MAHEMIPIDITNAPELRRLAEDVAAPRTPRVLRRDNEDVAVVVPASPKRSARRGQPTSEDDPLWQIIGMADAAASPMRRPTCQATSTSRTPMTPIDHDDPFSAARGLGRRRYLRLFCPQLFA